MYLCKIHLLVYVFAILIDTDFSERVISLEISHVETFEVGDDVPQDYIKNPYKELERELRVNEEVLYFDQNKKDGKSLPFVKHSNAQPPANSGTSQSQSVTQVTSKAKLTKQFKRKRKRFENKTDKCVNKDVSKKASITEKGRSRQVTMLYKELSTTVHPNLLKDAVESGVLAQQSELKDSVTLRKEYVKQPEMRSTLRKEKVKQPETWSSENDYVTSIRTLTIDKPDLDRFLYDHLKQNKNYNDRTKKKKDNIELQLNPNFYLHKSTEGRLLPSLLKRKQNDVQNQENLIDEINLFSSLARVRRQVGMDMNQLANQGWEKQYTTVKPEASGSKGDSFQVITDEDRRQAEIQKVKTVIIYLGSTLLSVFFFILTAYCFIKNPKGCLLSFGTGCPCCVLLLPCYNKCMERINPTKKLHENLNKYLPGVIIHEDGTLESYNPSPEEIEIVCDIIDEIIG